MRDRQCYSHPSTFNSDTYLETLHKSYMPGVHGNIALRKMYAIIKRVPHEDGERDSLHNAQLPPKTPKQTPQGEEDGHYGYDHGDDDSVVVCQDHHCYRAQDKGEEDTVEGAVNSHNLYVHLHPVFTGLES